MVKYQNTSISNNSVSGATTVEIEAIAKKRYSAFSKASASDCLVSNPEYSLGKSYLSADKSICRSPEENVYKFILTSPAVHSMSCLFYLDDM